MNRDGWQRLRADSWLPFAAFLLLSGLGIIGITWANHRFAESAPGGTDFLVHWVGMRAILKGENPYSDATALEIQTMVYGRPAVPGEHELRVAYPLYGEFLFLPFAWISDFSWARALWMTVLEICAAALGGFCLVLSGSAWTRWQRICFLLFSILWYFGIRAIINGNAIILISLFLGISIFCAKRNWNAAAGFFLACCTIKPQVAILPVLSVLLWGIHTRRFRMVYAFGAVMAVFVGLSFAVLPTWLADNWSEIVRYPLYSPPGTPADAIQAMAGAGGYWAGGLLSVSIWIFVLYAWMNLFRTREEGSLFLIGMTILLAPLSGIPTDPGNEFLLLLPLTLILSEKYPNPISAMRFAGILGAVFIGLWALFFLTVQKEGPPIQHPVMLFPMPFFMLVVWLWDGWRARRKKPYPS